MTKPLIWRLFLGGKRLDLTCRHMTQVVAAIIYARVRGLPVIQQCPLKFFIRSCSLSISIGDGGLYYEMIPPLRIHFLLGV